MPPTVHDRLAAARRLVAALESIIEAERNAKAAEETIRAFDRAGGVAPAPVPAPSLRIDRTDATLRAYLGSGKKRSVKDAAKAVLATFGPLTNSDLLAAIHANGYTGLQSKNASDALRGSLWHEVKAGTVVKGDGGLYSVPDDVRDAVRKEIA